MKTMIPACCLLPDTTEQVHQVGATGRLAWRPLSSQNLRQDSYKASPFLLCWQRTASGDSYFADSSRGGYTQLVPPSLTIGVTLVAGLVLAAGATLGVVQCQVDDLRQRLTVLCVLPATVFLHFCLVSRESYSVPGT